MAARYSYASKGKGIATDLSSPSRDNRRYSSQKANDSSRHSLTPRDRISSYGTLRTEPTRTYSPPPYRRIRAPVLDNSDLIKENALTLIGR